MTFTPMDGSITMNAPLIDYSLLARPSRRRSLVGTWLLALAMLLAPTVVTAAPATAAADTSVPGVLFRDDSLRAEPADDATAIQEVSKGSAVRVLYRDGAWYRVAAGEQQGWLRLVWVRTAGAAIARSATPAPARTISQSLAAARARRNQGQVTAALGVRGLSEEELQGASFDAEQMARLERLQANAAAAQGFASAGALRPREVAEVSERSGRAAGRTGGRNRR